MQFNLFFFLVYDPDEHDFLKLVVVYRIVFNKKLEI